MTSKENTLHDYDKNLLSKYLHITNDVDILYPSRYLPLLMETAEQCAKSPHS